MNKIDLTHDVPILLAILVLLAFVFFIGKPKTDLFKFFCYLLLIVAIFLMLFSCSPGKCYPSKKSRDYARVTRILHDQDNLVYVRAKMYRNEWHTFFKCLPDSIKLGTLVSVKGWEKI